MIDIHSHILPGLDDGARDSDEALAMLRLAAENGTTDIVATPHANWQFAFDPDVVLQKIEELQTRCGGNPRIHYGCDFHLSIENIESALAHPGRYTINQKGYLLVEFSDFQIHKSSTEIFEKLLANGMTPIITHPERNPILQKSTATLRSWIEQGCWIQVTGQSLTGRFGSQAETAAKDLMSQGLVHFVASDGHDTKNRPPSLAETGEWIRRHYGKQKAEELLVTNPRAVLSGADLNLTVRPHKGRWPWSRRYSAD